MTVYNLVTHLVEVLTGGFVVVTMEEMALVEVWYAAELLEEVETAPADVDVAALEVAGVDIEVPDDVEMLES